MSFMNPEHIDPLPPFSRIAVLGAGISGLSAAYRFSCIKNCLKNSLKIDVWDKNARVGGVLNTDQIGRAHV